MSKPEARNSALALAALGVVFGDIGTSPLYTMREIFAGAHHAVPISPENVLGILSLIFWSLTLIVAIKYATLIMRADNKGEGGIMALMALVLREKSGTSTGALLMLVGLFGAALFYGDSIMTPAISVLSAVEGIGVAAPALHAFIVPITLGVLFGLFYVQRHGTGKVGSMFGRVTLVWFLVLAILGIINIIEAPGVLVALNPAYAVRFFANNPMLGYLSLGAAVLAVTGAETLYADMGHFGRTPIRLAWFGLVLPALVLNYFGQGALLLTDPNAIANPFYLMAPTWALYPLIGLATAATVIASQAVITGTFSITRQAMQLGYVPRMEIQHTSRDEMGQIYLPGINWFLFCAVALLILGFRSSSNLASAYGIAVTGTMLIDTLLTFVVARAVWKWHPLLCVGVLGIFIAIDVAYFSANLLKIHEGGWFPLGMGTLAFIVMTTWKRGRALLNSRLSTESMPLDALVKSVGMGGVPSVPGTAIFMTSNPDIAPHPLLHSLKHYKCLHERIVFLTVIPLDVPHVAQNQRLTVERISDQFWRVKVYFGFMDEPNLPDALEWCGEQGIDIDLMDSTFFLGRETLIPKIKSDMAFWREKLFVAMFRNAGSAAGYFHLPPGRVVELGSQVVL
jgi:KUP system potassium uptake protein